MHCIHRAAPLTAVLVLVAILAACTATDPRLEDEPAASTDSGQAWSVAPGRTGIPCRLPRSVC